MSTQTETVKACPHGHISLRRNVTYTPPKRRDRRRTVNSLSRDKWKGPEHEFCCKTCERLDQYDTHFYDKKDLIEKSRRVNETLDYDVTMGYVWSPSHDDE